MRLNIADIENAGYTVELVGDGVVTDIVIRGAVSSHAGVARLIADIFPRLNGPTCYRLANEVIGKAQREDLKLLVLD